MKKLSFLIFSLLLLSQQAAFSQNNDNANGIGNGNENGVGTGNGSGGNGVKPVTQLPAEEGNTNEKGLIALPVTLTGFTASAGKNQVMLDWTTATEENNAFFQVERSQDGQHYAVIGQVKGNGTTHLAHQYSFKDVKPVAGTLYYRLRQVDLDGTSDLSPVKAVKATPPVLQPLPVYPNPVISDLHIELSTLAAGTYTLTVTSLTNGLVKQKVVQAGELVSLQLQDIPAGAYVVSILGENFKQTNKFFKS